MDNADLEKLKVSAGKLVPKFKASVTEYAVTLASKVSELKLTVLTSDSGASYVIRGIADGGKVVVIEEGQLLQVDVVVTAEDGTTTKTYSIKISRLCANDAQLSVLEISKGTLVPSFSPLIHNYECSLPCSVDTISMTVKTQEEAMKLSVADGSPIGTVKLNPGRTVCVLQVESADGSKKTEYIIVFNKTPLPPTLQLKAPNQRYECAVCCCIVNMSSRVDKGPFVYCKLCLEELTRTNKVDPFTGNKLEDGWLKLDFRRDGDLGDEEGVCPLPSGKVERTINHMGAKLMEERIKMADKEEPTEACKACSKRIPELDMALHTQLLCTAKHPISLAKKEVASRTWEKRLVDETSASVNELMKSAEKWEEQYLNSLPRPGDSIGKKDPLEHLMKATRALATAIHNSPKQGKYHIGLGMLLEEVFYAEDLYGLAPELPQESEGEAQISSKEEEFLAICKLHGISPSASVALQLKAVEAEYQSLKEAGQAHKADHVQALYAWKSKKVLEAGQGSYAVDKESPLYKAKMKYQDAVNLDPSDGVACYHLGRLSLLLGEKDAAREFLMSAVALKPTLSEARFCLGLILPPASEAHAKNLLLHGLTQYLTEQQLLYDTNPEPWKKKPQKLHAKQFYCGSNTLIAEGFLQLAACSGHGHLTKQGCLLSVTSCIPRAHIQHRASTHQRLMWSSLKARAVLLQMLHKQGSPITTANHCRQLSALINCSGLESTQALREMQMEVFQLGVVLQPNSCEALCHLGNGQLKQYEAGEKDHWLKDAELSFRASIAMEGKPISSTVIPDKLKEQDWWKNRMAPKEPLTSAKATPAAGKQPAASTTKQPPGKAMQPPAGRARGGGPVTSRTQSVPSGRGSTGSGRGSVAPGRGGVGPGRGSAAAPKTGPAGAKKPGVGVGGAKAVSLSKPGSVQKSNSRVSAGGTSGKTVATLGELKTGRDNSASKAKESASVPPAGKEEPSGKEASSTNNSSPKQEGASSPSQAEGQKSSHLPRLGLARVLTKSKDAKRQQEAHKLYREVMKMSPDFHDAYIELGEILAKSDPAGAVEVYAKFPFTQPPTFDDAYLHGEIIRLVMKSENYTNPQLAISMIAMGKALGIGVLDKQVAILEGKFKYKLLKTVYAGVHGKAIDNPELVAFFKFKCWT